jgi:hypothetical protein
MRGGSGKAATAVRTPVLAPPRPITTDGRNTQQSSPSMAAKASSARPFVRW